MNFQAEKDPDWPQLAIWPEGTTHNRLSAVKFKSGAFIPGCPVLPMTVKFNNRWDTYTWGFQGPSFFQLFFYTMTQLYMVMELRFLPIVTPTEEEKGYLK